MAAPEGNQFWEKRATHGRDKIFTDHNALWESAVEYFIWCQGNPLYEKDWVGKNAKEVNKPKMRAMSIKGFTIFLGVNSGYFTDFEDALRPDEDQTHKDFSIIIRRIKDVIWSQKFEGAAAGLLNQSVICREIGLVEKTDHTTNGKDITPIVGMRIIDQPDGDNL